MNEYLECRPYVHKHLFNIIMFTEDRLRAYPVCFETRVIKKMTRLYERLKFSHTYLHYPHI